MKRVLSIFLIAIFLIISSEIQGDDIHPEYKNCVQLLIFQKYNETQKCIETMILQNPDWWYSYYLKAKVMRALSRESEFKSNLDKALRLAGNNFSKCSIYYESVQYDYLKSSFYIQHINELEKCYDVSKQEETKDLAIRINQILTKIYIDRCERGEAEKLLIESYTLQSNEDEYDKLLEMLNEVMGPRLSELSCSQKETVKWSYLNMMIEVSFYNYNEALAHIRTISKCYGITKQ